MVDPDRIRTGDLLVANEALYQLSYGPLEAVGVEGIEPSTSVLSGQRSTTELHTRVKLPSRRSGRLSDLAPRASELNYVPD